MKMEISLETRESCERIREALEKMGAAVKQAKVTHEPFGYPTYDPRSLKVPFPSPYSELSYSNQMMVAKL